MSPIAASLLLDAVERTCVPEDRLTEILAHVLQADSLFRDKFCALCGAPALPKADVRTQRRLANGRRVDLELLLRGDGRTHAVWVEVKAGAPEGVDQLRDYAVELHRLFGERVTLVALAPRGDNILGVARGPSPFGAHLAEAVEWQQLIGVLNASGRERGGSAWREAAEVCDSSLPNRTLLELYAYAQRRKGVLGTMPDEPLQVTDALALSRYHALIERDGLIDNLLALAAGHAGGDAIELWMWKDMRGFIFRGLTPPRWATDFATSDEKAYLELWFSWTDVGFRSDEPRKQAAFLTSLTIDRPSEEARVALHDANWILYDWAVTSEDKTQYRISAIRYLVEVAVSGVTLSEQAEALGVWAREVLERLQTLPLPPSAAVSSAAG